MVSAHQRALTLLAAVAAPAHMASAEPLGCFIYGWAVQSSFFNTTSVNATDCQRLCAANGTCAVFGYFPDSGECWFGSDPNSPYDEKPVPVIGGPAVCTEAMDACQQSVAPAGWPESTASASMTLWPGNFQPQKLQCYTDDCWNALQPAVLEDAAVSWSQLCMGMTDATAWLGPNQDCEQHCAANVSCPAFQVGADGRCWQGIGFNCSVPRAGPGEFNTTLGKRFKRGEVKVLRELVNEQIMDLMQVFGWEEMEIKGTEGSKQECADICASILNCEYWQLSNISGCWVEGPNDPVQYPLVHGYGGLHETTNLAETMIAGAYVQRFCPPEPMAPTGAPTTPAVVAPEVETTTAAPASVAGWGIALILLLLCCCLATCIGAAFALGLCGKKEPKRAKRSLKNKVHAQQSQPLVAQPPQNTTLFDRIDANHDGFITKEEFMRSVQVLPMTGQQVTSAAASVQPLPTVSMPMPTYQMAAQPSAQPVMQATQVMPAAQYTAAPAAQAFSGPPGGQYTVAPQMSASASTTPLPVMAPQPGYAQQSAFPPQVPM